MVCQRSEMNSNFDGGRRVLSTDAVCFLLAVNLRFAFSQERRGEVSLDRVIIRRQGVDLTH